MSIPSRAARYHGAYDPIISKELYLNAQANLQAPPRRHPGTNEFDFTKLLYCGACGSGITAEEKFKHQKNGNTHRYVYYHCTKSADKYCKEKPIREEELQKQLLRFIDKVDLDEIGIKEQIQQEISNFRKLSYGVLGQEVEILNNRSMEADTRNFAKHILVNGTREKKRELVGCLNSKIEIKDKVVYLRIKGQ